MQIYIRADRCLRFEMPIAPFRCLSMTAGERGLERPHSGGMLFQFRECLFLENWSFRGSLVQKKDAHKSGRKPLGMAKVLVVKAGSKGKELFRRPLRHLEITHLAPLPARSQSSVQPPGPFSHVLGARL